MKRWEGGHVAVWGLRAGLRPGGGRGPMSGGQVGEQEALLSPLGPSRRLCLASGLPRGVGEKGRARP